MATLKERLDNLNIMMGKKLNSVKSWATSEFDSVYQSIIDTNNAIPTDNTELTNGAGYINSSQADNYQNWNLRTDGVQRTTIQSGGVLDLKAGSNMSVTYGAGGVVTFSPSFTQVTSAMLSGGTDTTPRLVAAKTLNDWLVSKNYDNYDRWRIEDDVQGSGFEVTSGAVVKLSGGTNVTIDRVGGVFTFNANIPSYNEFSHIRFETSTAGDGANVGDEGVVRFIGGNNTTVSRVGSDFTIDVDVPAYNEFSHIRFETATSGDGANVGDGGVVRLIGGANTTVSRVASDFTIDVNVPAYNEFSHIRFYNQTSADGANVGDEGGVGFKAGDNMTITRVGSEFTFAASIPSLSWNNISNKPTTKSTVLEVDSSLLTTPDKAGLVEYLNNTGFTKADLETVFVKLVVSDVVPEVDPNYQAVLDYATANNIPLPTQSQQDIDNQLIKDYKATGGWDKDDIFFKFKGTADPSFKLICWKRLIQATAYGGLTWSVDGVLGDAFNGYIDPHYIPDGTGNWKLNNAGIGISFFNHGAYGNFHLDFGGVTTGGYVYFTTQRSGSSYYNINSTSLYSGTEITTLGYTSMNRISSTTGKIIDPVGSVQTVSANSTALPTQNLLILARNNKGSVDSFSRSGLSFVTSGASRELEHNNIKAVLN